MCNRLWVLMFLMTITLVITACEKSQSSVAFKDKKPSAPIALVSDNIIYTLPNQTINTSVNFMVNSAATKMQVNVTASPELDLITVPSTKEIDVESQKNISLPLQFNTREEGRYYIHFLLELNDNEKIPLKDISIIIQVGPEIIAHPMPQKNINDNVTRMPVVESSASRH